VRAKPQFGGLRSRFATLASLVRQRTDGAIPPRTARMPERLGKERRLRHKRRNAIGTFKNTKRIPMNLSCKLMALPAFAALMAATPSTAQVWHPDQRVSHQRADLVQDARWRGHWPRGEWSYHRHGPRGWAPPAAAFTGAIVGGMLAADAARSDWLAYCSAKYRSFDPATGTYLGYDGDRHPCR
jgi:hypothetical protein